MFGITISTSVPVFAQKRPVDTAMIKQLSAFGEGVVSPDGRYAVYEHINNLALHTSDNINLVVKSVQTDWSLSLDNGWQLPLTKFVFGGDHRWLLLSKSDSIKILDLTTKKIATYTGVLTFKDYKGQLFLLHQKEAGNELVLQNSLDESKVLVSNLNNTSIDEYGDSFLLNVSSGGRQLFQKFQPESGKLTPIFSAEQGVQVIPNTKATKFAYLRTAPDGPQVWLYDGNIGKEEQVLTSHPLPHDKEMVLNSLTGFSSNDDRLIFTVKSAQDKSKKETQGSALVKIWHYKSENLTGKHNSTTSFAAVLLLRDKTVRRLQFKNDEFPNISGDWALVTYRFGDGTSDEQNWNKASLGERRLVSLLSGKTRTVDRYANFSPNGKYLTWFDKQKRIYLFYDFSDGREKDLLKPIKGSRLDYYHDRPDSGSYTGWDFHWFNHDSLLLVRDQFNVWRINMAGDQVPVRLTGTGHQDHVTYDFLETGNTLRSGDTLYLAAFDRYTKANGLYRLVYGQRLLSEKLFMWPYLTFTKSYHSQIGSGAIVAPVKAASTNVWLILRQSAEEAPNYFTTSDFKTFKPLTDLHPERGWNWMTSELYHWKGLNCEQLQGILYKPENFDPTKKYPVIFYYYEKVSDALHRFIYPELCSGPLEIPWFVSRGYLVFAPDIYYRIGYTGQSALSSVESAAQLIEKLPFVNPQKMGIEGHSFGGFETNYIITHSHRFAAASSASGINDMIADYEDHGPNQFEVWQYRIGASLFDRPDLYIENSPILRLKQVTTPLLIMHTTEDTSCPYVQGKALFQGLRRLQKPAWLLVYPNANHTLSEPAAMYDYTQRMQQFFDHYLKDAPMPDWMKYPQGN